MQQRRFAGFEQVLNLGNFKRAPTGGFAHVELTLRAGKASVVFFDHATTTRAGGFERGVIPWNSVGLVFFGAFDDDLRHLRDFAHECVALEFAAFHLCEFVFPVACEFGRGQLLHTQSAQKGEQLKRFGGRDDFASLAHKVFFSQQTLDNRRARRRCTQTFTAHGGFEFLIVEQFARAFHR